MITRLAGHASPFGGAARLLLTSSTPDAYALVLASADPTPPPPSPGDGRRVVHQGRLRHRAAGDGHVFQVLDLDTDSLPDGEDVFYHVYTLVDPTPAAPLTVKVTPRCLRTAIAQLIRDLVKPRLRYHLKRGQDSGAIREFDAPIAIYEQEVRNDGPNLPAIFIKESASPDPSAETIGKGGAAPYRDLHAGVSQREMRHAFRTRLDVLLLCANPDDRANLSRFLMPTFLADLEYYMHAGIENPQVSRTDRHDIDPEAGTDLYATEITLTGTTYVNVVEELSYTVPDGVTVQITPR